MTRHNLQKPNQKKIHFVKLLSESTKQLAKFPQVWAPAAVEILRQPCWQKQQSDSADFANNGSLRGNS